MEKGINRAGFILDKSGSMSVWKETRSAAIIPCLKSKRRLRVNAALLRVLFDKNYELLHDRIDIRAVNPITEKEYQVGGFHSAS
jgi:uncharacterized protein with von Willebrand factor type A (vWA) domain